MLFAVRRSEVHAANARIVARSESSQITVDRGVVATVSRRDGKALGSGRALFLSDVDLISNASLTAGNTIGNNNDRFLGNLLAFAGSGAAPPPPPAVFAPVPALDHASLLLLALILFALGWRGLRQG
ncbi:MAG: IPTL-CTERM sorting domain-containing protein [Betaproteobacteria bacterium]|nr:MAG: IPTL-CTERM sorting domain-containing protein [Betaproteobacteria bacterium]